MSVKVYNYNQFCEILNTVNKTDFIPDDILGKTPIISYNQWQKVNKVKPEYEKNISMILNKLTNENIDVQVKELKKYICSESKVYLIDNIIKNILINSYYCSLYIDFLFKLNIVIPEKKIIENINYLEKELSNENLIIKDKLIGLMKFICFSINNNTYDINLITSILDKDLDKIECDSISVDIKYIYADIIKTIVQHLKENINKSYLDRFETISKNKSKFTTRIRFIFLDICDLYKK